MLNSETQAIKFTSCPCFTILNPGSYADRINAVQWPGKRRMLAEVISFFEPETVTVTVFAHDSSRRYWVSEEDLRTAISETPGVNL